MQVIKKGETLPAYAPLELPDLNDRAAAPPANAWAAAPEVESFFPPVEAPLPRAVPEEDPALIVERARAEAAELISSAVAQAREIERTAREKAITEVRATLAAEAAEEAAGLRRQLAETIAELSELREQMATYGEHEMVQLAVEIAKKIVRREVTVDREIVISLARVALSRLHNRALASIRLHPDDYQYLAAHRDKLGTGSTVKLIEDASISRGGCLIETDFGDVDARIEQQFSEIERGFLNDLGA